MKILNKEVYKQKKISVFVGSYKFGRTPDLIDVCLEIWPVSGINHVENNFTNFDDRHPWDQVFDVKRFMENYTDVERTRFVITNSPYVVQSIIHFSGFDSKNVGIYECKKDDNGDVILTDCSDDCRGIFTEMAGPMDGIMDVIRDSEERERLEKMKMDSKDE